MKVITTLIISILLFVACEKTLRVTIEDKGRKIVVNGIFTADSLLSVRLLESQHIQSGEYVYSPLSDASISLVENDIEIESSNSNLDGEYQFNYLPKENANYTIVVNAEKYGQATAKSYIPEKIAIEKIEYKLNEISNEYSTYIDGMDLKLHFKDIENKANYYLVQLYSIESSSYFDSDLNENVTYTNEYYLDLNSYDPSVTIANFDINGLIFNDELFDGKLHTLSFFIDYFNYGGANESIKYYILLYNLSEDLYNYYLSYTKYMGSKDDPFSEPVKVYNNIENGFGIFGGSSITVDSIEIVVPSIE